MESGRGGKLRHGGIEGTAGGTRRKREGIEGDRDRVNKKGGGDEIEGKAECVQPAGWTLAKVNVVSATIPQHAAIGISG